MMSTDIAVKLDNVSKFYKLYNSPKDRLKEALNPLRKKYHKEFYALKDVNLEVRKGEVLGVVGKNGSGKSTLLKIISGVLPPSMGNAQVKGNISALLELGAGFNPDFTGIENVYFYGSLIGYSRDQMDAKLDDILLFADIGDFVNQPMKHYSTGMKMRLAFAVSTAIDPELLILDEVLAVGDELFRRKCYARMEYLMSGGQTILFVSHDAQSVNQLCTRAILLDKGELILEGPAKLVTSQYERFLYAKQENVAKVRNEILTLNGDAQLKNSIAQTLSIKEKPQKGTSIQQAVTSDDRKPNHKTTPIDQRVKEVTDQKPFYVPELKPKSMVEYRDYDVDIYEIHIGTLDSQKVNMLVMDEEYLYSYKVKFNMDVTNVSLGMQFKSEKGIRIGGAASHRIHEYINKAAKGDEYLVEWRFKCSLLQGTYYTNVGVATTINGEQVYLNRIVDALVFKVQHVPNTAYAGLVHFDQDLSISKVS